MAINIEDENDMLDDYSHLTGWKKNPYAKKIHRSRTFFLDETIIKRFDELAKENGTYRDEFIERVLLNYLSQAEKQNIATTSN